MVRISYNQFCDNLASYINGVCSKDAALFVDRPNAPSVVMMSVSHYDGLVETVHRLTSPANAARLLLSIKEADQSR